MREMKEYGLREPEFIDMEIGFRVNLYRKQNGETSQETNQEAYHTGQETNKTADCHRKRPPVPCSAASE